MTRPDRDFTYNERREPTRTFEGFDVSVPTAGFYRMKLRSNGHPVGVRVWFGPPLDPITREELDRGHRWQATVNNRDILLERVWPACGRNPITQAEHDYLADLQTWAEQNAPDSPQANPHQPIDLLKAPIPF